MNDAIFNQQAGISRHVLPRDSINFQLQSELLQDVVRSGKVACLHNYALVFFFLLLITSFVFYLTLGESCW